MKSNLKIPVAFTLATAFLAVACVCGGASFTATPIGDAFVTTGPSGNLSGNNYGAAGALAVAASGLPQGQFQTVLKFDLSGARDSFDLQFGAGLWTPQSVTLRLTASPHSNAIFNNVAAGLFNVSLMQNNSWVEGTGTGGTPTADGISFNSLQSTFVNNAADQALGTFGFGGATSGANDYALVLAPGLVAKLLAGGVASPRLFADDNNVSYLFSSRASGSGPQLIVTAVPEPGSIALGVLGLATLLVWRRRTRA
jgi:MYXO-CTERM domain-containing protein